MLLSLWFSEFKTAYNLLIKYIIMSNPEKNHGPFKKFGMVRVKEINTYKIDNNIMSMRFTLLVIIFEFL